MESVSHSRSSPPHSSQGMAGRSLPSGKMRNCSVGSVNISAVLSPVSKCPGHCLLIRRGPVQKQAARSHCRDTHSLTGLGTHFQSP